MIERTKYNFYIITRRKDDKGRLASYTELRTGYIYKGKKALYGIHKDKGENRYTITDLYTGISTGRKISGQHDGLYELKNLLEAENFIDDFEKYCKVLDQDIFRKPDMPEAMTIHDQYQYGYVIQDRSSSGLDVFFEAIKLNQ